MYLTSLSLAHFRSHRSVSLELDARPVVIHGPNGAGKTNLIEAVSLFSPGRGLRRAAAAQMLRRPHAPGWKVGGVVSGAGHAHEVSFTCAHGAGREVRIDGKAATQVALGRIARAVWLVPSMDRLWIEGAEGRRRFLDRVTLSFLPDHAQVAMEYEKAMRERNRLLKEQIKDAHWYRALERQMAHAGAQVIANRRMALARLLTAQEGAQTAFPTVQLEMIHAQEWGGDGEADLLNGLQEGRSRDLTAGRTLIGPHRADLQAVYTEKGVSAAECSTGEQKALLISLILANARALSGEIGAMPILLLDEVSAHLDATRRNALYDEICALGAQAWMTGTGPELFSGLGSRAQEIRVDSNGEVSQVRPD